MEPNFEQLRQRPQESLSRTAALADRLRLYASSEHQTSEQTFIIDTSDVTAVVTHALTRMDMDDEVDVLFRMINLTVIPRLKSTDDFATVFTTASGSSTSGVCGVVWKSNEYAYKCRTCERDPTCVICDQCFRFGDHSGHDYAMVRTGGGCCDCGDPQAWQREGFCSRHKGPSSELDDPVANMDSDFQFRLIAATQAVAARVLVLTASLHRYADSSDNLPEDNEEYTIRLLAWMASVSQGDGPCRAIGKLLTEIASPWLLNALKTSRSDELLEIDKTVLQDQSWLSLMLSFDGIGRLPAAVQLVAQTLYFKLITDTIFKRTFFECFVNNYERYIHAHMKFLYNQNVRGAPNSGRLKRSDIVQSFSVQLFTVPAFVSLMTREGGLLDIMLHVLLNLFEISSSPACRYETNIPYEESALATKYSSRKDACTALKTSLGFFKNGSVQDQASSNSGVHDNRTHMPIETVENFHRHDVSELLNTIERDQQHSQESDQEGVGIISDDDINLIGETTDHDGNNIHPNAEDVVSVHITLRERVLEDGDAEEQPVNVDETLTRLNEEVHSLTGLLAESEDIINSEHSVVEDVLDENNDAVIVINEGMVVAAEGLGIIQNNEQLQDDVPINLFFHLTTEGTEATNPENDEAENETDLGVNAQLLLRASGSRRTHRSLLQQIRTFEDGMHFKPSSFNRIVPLETAPNVPITRARKSTSKALDGTGVVAHPLRVTYTSDDKINVDTLIWRVMSDMSFVLSHEAAAFHFLHQRPRPFRLLLRILSMVQGMVPSARRFGDHSPHLADDWSRGFTLESEFYRIFDLVSNAFCCRDSTKFVNVLGSSVLNIDLPLSRRRLISMIRGCLDEWLLREQMIEAMSTYAGEEFTVAHSQSVYYPLHRLLSLFAHHVIRVDNTDVAAALSLGTKVMQSEEARRILLHPLRLQSFFAQVRAGMWRRNGHPVNHQAITYTKLAYSEWFVELDLFLQQCCAVILGPEEFIMEAKRVFRISDLGAVVDLINQDAGAEEQQTSPLPLTSRGAASPSTAQSVSHTQSQGANSSFMHSAKKGSVDDQFGLLPLAPRHLVEVGTISGTSIVKNMGNTKRELAKFMQSVVEEFLVFIIRVSSDRSRCGQSTLQWLRSRIVHELAPESKSYTSVRKNCSFITVISDAKVVNDDDDGTSNISEAAIESVLSQVAEYIPPKGMKQGTYCLKDDIWREFDLFCPHLLQRERCSAEVRYSSVCKRENRQPHVIPMENIAERPIYTQFFGLMLIPLVACGAGANGFARVLLQKFARSEGAAHWSGALVAALHLLCMFVESCNCGQYGTDFSQFLGETAETESLSDSAIGALCELSSNLESAQSNLFLEFKPVFERILQSVYFMTSSRVQNLVLQKCPHSLLKKVRGRYDENSDTGLSPEEKRRRFLQQKKKEQQKAAMQTFQLAQKKFAKLISDGEDSNTSLLQGMSFKIPEVNNENKGTKPTARTTDVADSSGHLELGEVDEGDQCVQCHGIGYREGKNGLIGLIGFQQLTQIPEIARRTSNSRARCDEVPHVQGFSKYTNVEESGKVQEVSDASNRRSLAEFSMGEVGLLSSMNKQVIKNGIEKSRTTHVSLCGHAVHVDCFEGFFNSLLRSKENQMVFAGSEVVDLDKREFFCPGCRRLSNLILPKVMHPRTERQSISKMSHESKDFSFDSWIDEISAKVKQECDVEHVSTSKNISPFGLKKVRKFDDLERSAFSARVIKLMKEFRFTGTDGREGDCDRETSIHELLAWFANCLLSTLACVEISARMVEWNDPLLQQARKSVYNLMQVFRDLIGVEGGIRSRALKILWDFMREKSTMRKDPFVCVGLLVVLWPYQIAWSELKMIMRLGFTKLVEEHGEVTRNTLQFLMKALLFCRRAVLLGWATADDMVAVRVRHFGKSPDLTAAKQELFNLMDIFEIGLSEIRLAIDAVGTNQTVRWKDVQVGFLPQRVGLIELPSEFGVLLEQMGKVKCSVCGLAPKTQMVCLICGIVVVVCNPENCTKKGGFEVHSKHCGGGVGVCLSLNSTTVEIRRWKRRTEWGFLYLDTHGEGDELLSRGKALYLCDPRYQLLEKLWILHGFDQDSYILSRGPRQHEFPLF